MKLVPAAAAACLCIALGLTVGSVSVAQADSHSVSAHASNKPKHTSSRSRVRITVSVGFDGFYRWLTDVPVRVSATNLTTSSISGNIVIPSRTTDPSAGYSYGPVADYRAPIVLPPHASKTVTLYMPAWSLNYAVRATLVESNHALGSAASNPQSFAANTISACVITIDPGGAAWLSNANPGGGDNIHAIAVPPTELDSNPSVLKNFGVIVLRTTSTDQLSAAQLLSLQAYVSSGGGLIVIGGANWQQTVPGLPSSLFAGHVSGLRTLPNLDPLSRLLDMPPLQNPSGTALISAVSRPSGDVLASENGIPLVVDRHVGSGHVMFLAFDPTVQPVTSWPSEDTFLGRIVDRANPAAAALGPDWSSATSVLSPSPFFTLPNNSTSNIGWELENIPSPALMAIVLFLVLAGVFTVLLGPVLFVVLRRKQRLEWVWVILPAGALVSMGATFGVGQLTQSHSALANTIGMVTLTGPSTARPASFYTGVFAPIGGSYHLSYGRPGVAEVVPDAQANAYGKPSLKLEEGSTTDAYMSDVPLWHMSTAGLTTTVPIEGDITYGLHLTPTGEIQGWVRNETSLDLISPVIVAGHGFSHLPNLGPHGEAAVRVTPENSVYGHQSTIWQKIYGSYTTGFCLNCYRFGYSHFYDATFTGVANANGPRGIHTTEFGGEQPSCCYGYGPASEHTLRARIRNAATQIPDAQTLDSTGEVTFTAWTEQPLIPIQVNGTTPLRRDLNLIVKPLSVSFAPGRFRFRTGTFGATLVDVHPAQPDSGDCCSSPIQGAIEVGDGGSATYQFNLASLRPLHVTRLAVYVNASGANRQGMGHVWSWSKGRWVKCDLSKGGGDANLIHPQQFVSRSGEILLNLVTHDTRSDMYFPDARRDIQITGQGWVS